MQKYIRWQVDGAKIHYFDGIEPTKSRSMKRSFSKEYHIVTTDLLEYLDIERQFNEYELGLLSIPLETYYPTIIHECYTNYLAMLKKDFPNGKKVSDMENLVREL